MKYFKSKKGFTLIELIITISVVSILVLLVSSNLLKFTEDTKEVQVKNDVKSYESEIQLKLLSNEDLTNDWEIVSNSIIEGRKDSLFGKGGRVSNDIDFSNSKNTYLKIPKEFKGVKSNLDGDFYLMNLEKVYYYEGQEDEEEKAEEIKYHLAQDDDFQFIEFDGSGSYVGPNNKIGYFRYIGRGEESIEIPHTIQGVEMTSYYNMFIMSGEDVKNVSSTNKNIVVMSDMFHMSRINELNLNHLETSNVIDMSGMFQNSQIQTLNLKGFNTEKVIDMNSMFKYSKIKDLDLSSFNTGNVTDMDYIFLDSSIITGYANKSSVDKFNNSLDKPVHLIFKIK